MWMENDVGIVAAVCVIWSLKAKKPSKDGIGFVLVFYISKG